MLSVNEKCGLVGCGFLIGFWANEKCGLGDGWLEFTTKSRFYWHTTNYLGTRQGFANEQKEIIFVLHPKFFTLLKIEDSVDISPQWHNLDELPVLLLFGWYLSVGSQYAGRT